MFGQRPVVFEPAETYEEALLDTAIEQIREDLAIGDASAIYDLLKNIPMKFVEGFLPEWELKEIQEKWSVKEGSA
jgi:hypothetical protein